MLAKENNELFYKKLNSDTVWSLKNILDYYRLQESLNCKTKLRTARVRAY